MIFKTQAAIGFGESPAFNHYDILLADNCDVDKLSHSNFGFTYVLPDDLEYDSDEAKKYLAGSEYFGVKDFEVFKVNF